MNRFRSPAAWLALGALVAFCVKKFVGIDVTPTVDGLLDVLLPTLAAFGILNNPTDREHF